MMNDVPVLDKEMSTTGKNLSDSIVEKYAFVFQSCDVDMKLLVENKVSHYPTSDVLLKKLVSCIGIRRLDGSRHWLLFRKNMEIAWPWMERMPLKL